MSVVGMYTRCSRKNGSETGEISWPGIGKSRLCGQSSEQRLKVCTPANNSKPTEQLIFEDTRDLRTPELNTAPRGFEVHSNRFRLVHSGPFMKRWHQHPDPPLQSGSVISGPSMKASIHFKKFRCFRPVWRTQLGIPQHR